MRIGIDMRAFVRTGTGIPRVLRQILNELVKIDETNSYFLYSDRDFNSPFPETRWHKRFHNKLPFLPGTVWLYSDARRMIAKDQTDLFWGPGGYLPPGLPASTARVITVHDVVWKKYPNTMGRFNRLTRFLLLDRSIRDATALIAVSKSTASEIRDLLGIPESKIHMVYNGVGTEFRPYSHEEAANYISQKYHVSRDYVLAVGSVQPRKNLGMLFRGLKILREKYGFRHQLVIAGATGWKNSPIYRSLKEVGLVHGEVMFPGYIDEADLAKAYSGATVFVMPSLYEGFGLPLLEAMACGVPVISSDASALVEVSREAALIVPSQRPDLWAEAINRVTKDGTLRDTMIGKGYARAQQFSWQRSATQVLKVFEEAYSSRRG